MANMSIMEALKMIYGGQTPETNKAVGVEADLTGVNGEPGTLYNHKGEEVTDPSVTSAYEKARTGGYLDKPFKPISGISSFFNPQAANYVAEKNADYTLAPVLAGRQNSIARDIDASNFRTVRNVQGIPLTDSRISDTQGGILTGGHPTAQNMLSVNTDAERQSAGLPRMIATLEGSQNLANQASAKENLAATNERISQQPTTFSTQRNFNRLANVKSEGELGRLPTSEATLDQEAVNQLAKVTQIDPAQIALTKQELEGELGRSVSKQELLNVLLKNQGTSANIDKSLLQTKESLVPYAQTVMKNQAVGEAWDSRFRQAPGAPIGTLINQDGTVIPGTRIPGYVNMLDTINAKLPQGASSPYVTDTKGLPVKGPDGAPLMKPKPVYNAQSGATVTPAKNVLTTTHTPVISSEKPNTMSESTRDNKIVRAPSQQLSQDEDYGHSDIGHIFRKLFPNSPLGQDHDGYVWDNQLGKYIKKAKVNNQ